MIDPLPAPIESVAKHDPYINKKFLALMEQPEMVDGDFTDGITDFQRAVEVGLPVNDPERIVPPVEQALQVKPSDANDPRDVMNGSDSDGDSIHAAYNEDKSLIYLRTSKRGYYIPMRKVPGLIEWLQSRLDKHNKNHGETV